MKLDLQNYSSEFHRPTPIVMNSEKLLVVATPWGSSDVLTPLVTHFFESLQNELSQLESSQTVNLGQIVRNQINTFNELIIELNNEEWLYLVECLVVISYGRELHYFSIGQHHIFHHLNSVTTALLVSKDWSSGAERSSEQLSPVPKNCLGFMHDLRFQEGSEQVLETSKFFICSRSHFLAHELLKFSESVSSMTQQFAHHQIQMPFWLAQLEVQNVSTN